MLWKGVFEPSLKKKSAVKTQSLTTLFKTWEMMITVTQEG